MRAEEDIVRMIEYVPADAMPLPDGSYGIERRTLEQILEVQVADGVKVKMKIVRLEVFHYDCGHEIKVHVEIDGFPYERPLDSIYPRWIIRQRYDTLYPDGEEIINAYRK